MPYPAVRHLRVQRLDIRRTGLRLRPRCLVWYKSSLNLKNSALQSALREEVLHAVDEKGGNELEYEVIMDQLPLLDAVLKETLRL